MSVTTPTPCAPLSRKPMTSKTPSPWTSSPQSPAKWTRISGSSKPTPSPDFSLWGRLYAALLVLSWVCRGGACPALLGCSCFFSGRFLRRGGFSRINFFKGGGSVFFFAPFVQGPFSLVFFFHPPP